MKQKPNNGSRTYKGVNQLLGRYWVVYGGWPALIWSPYFHLSLVLLVITASQWINPLWWDSVLSIVPNLLGFTLGGFAIFLSFGDDRFKAI